MKVVLPDVDQRVLLGEFRERDAKPLSVFGIERLDDRLPASAGELMLHRSPRRSTDAVADLDISEAPDLGDLSGRDRRALHGAPAPP